MGLPSRFPGTDARSQSARIFLTSRPEGGSAGGKGDDAPPAPGSGADEVTRLLPAAPKGQRRQPWLGVPNRPGCRRASPAAACSPPGSPPPRPRRAGTSEPRPLGASRRRSERPSSSLRRRQRQLWRGKGRGAQEAVLPAAAAASRNSSAEPVHAAPQRSTAARAGTPAALPSPTPGPAPAASLPQGQQRTTAPPTDPRIRVGGGRWSHLVWSGSGIRGASVPLSAPWGLPVTPISRVSCVWTCCRR